MSFTQYTTQDQLEVALKKMESSANSPLLMAISESVKTDLKEAFPYNKFQLYSYETTTATYWFGVRNFDVVKELFNQSTFLFGPFIHATVEGEIVDSELLSAFTALDEHEHLNDGQPRLLLVTGVEFKQKLLKLLPPPKGGNDAFRYYMTEQQRKELLETELEVPAGYELGSATVEDAKFITDNWQFAGPGDDVQTRRKIECFPSSCVRFNGHVVAYEIADYAGMLNNQFTVPEHRGKGLGKLVELDLSKKLIRQGNTVYKHVDCKNPVAVPYTDRSRFFTRSNNLDGSPVIVSYVDL